MSDSTSNKVMYVSPSSGDTVACPCCGEPIPNLGLIDRIDFDPDEWQGRVETLTGQLRDGFPEYRESADAFAALIVSVSIYLGSLPKHTRETVEKEAKQLPLPLPTGFVYFIQSIDGGPVKIGYSKDPESRARNLQTAEELVVLATLPGSYKLEADLHHKYASIRMNGEWFQDAPELMEFIAHVRSQYPRVSS